MFKKKVKNISFLLCLSFKAKFSTCVSLQFAFCTNPTYMMHNHYDGWKIQIHLKERWNTNLLRRLQSYQPSILFKITSKLDHICNIWSNHHRLNKRQHAQHQSQKIEIVNRFEGSYESLYLSLLFQNSWKFKKTIKKQPRTNV